MKIDSDIPPPIMRGRGYRKYPFREMDIDQSFFAAETIKNVGQAAWWCTYKTGRKFTCRTVTENGVKGTRCWRIA